jgi:hypothetical protein
MLPRTVESSSTTFDRRAQTMTRMSPSWRIGNAIGWSIYA